MLGICVVHLVREANGPEPFKAFLDSYRAHAAGVKHELLIVFKGFAGKRAGRQYRDLLDDIPHRSLFVPDEGFDIIPYFNAARASDYGHYLFLNSFSV
nr:hypothetical protein [Acidobacteriota bacterium]